MKSYFIYTNDQQQGPFSVQDLKEMGINQGTPVWKEGFESWRKAGEIEELNLCFGSVPPPYSPNLSSTMPRPDGGRKILTAKRVGKTVLKVLVWTIVIIFAINIVGFVYNRVNADDSPYSAPPVDPEQSNPAAYLDVTGGYRDNFWGDKVIIKGTVSNSATHTNYKDVYVTVNFYTKTSTVIQSKSYVLYDYFPYGMKKEFELKVSKPSNAATCGVEATSATAY